MTQSHLNALFQRKIDISHYVCSLFQTVMCREFAVVPCVANPTCFEIPNIVNYSFFSSLFLPSYPPAFSLPFSAAFLLLSWWKTWALSAPNYNGHTHLVLIFLASLIFFEHMSNSLPFHMILLEWQSQGFHSSFFILSSSGWCIFKTRPITLSMQNFVSWGKTNEKGKWLDLSLPIAAL